MKPKYYLQIDLLKSFAIISVILMHSFAELAKTSANTQLLTYMNSNTISTASIIQLSHISLFGLLESFKIFTLWQAVPIFFILMGLNLGMSFKRRNYINIKDIYSKIYFKSR